MMGTCWCFQSRNANILPKFKEIKPLRGGVACYAVQARAQIDAEIGQKGHLWMETNLLKRHIFSKLRSISIRE